MIQEVAVGEGGGGVAHKRDERVGRSKFCPKMRGCADGGSWRERDASVKLRTLPRQTMGGDVSGGGFCGAMLGGTEGAEGDAACTYILYCVYVTNTEGRMEVREGGCGSRAAALPSTWQNPSPHANIHKQVHVTPDGCLEYLSLHTSRWSEVK